jgi:Holliday junction resolvase RusA-like endonuclease
VSLHTIRVNADPEAQARHRTFFRGTVRVDMSPKSAFRNAVQVTAAFNRPKDGPYTDPVLILTECIFRRPKSIKKAHVLKATKPDSDNLEKGVFDALKEAGWFKDDGIIALNAAVKRYASEGEAPGAVIYTRQLPRGTGEVEEVISLRDWIRA